MNNENKKAQRRERLAERIMLGLAFLVTLAIMASTKNEMTPLNFGASSFVLTFVFVGITDIEYLYKMPALISTAIIIGTFIAGKQRINKWDINMSFF